MNIDSGMAFIEKDREREGGAADRQAKTETNGAGGSVLTITANKREKLLERT